MTVLQIVQNTRASYPTVVITSVNDSRHGTNSRHYTNEAVDVRTHNFFDLPHKELFVSDVKKWLGNQFTVLHESLGTANEHIHIQVKKNATYSGMI